MKTIQIKIPNMQSSHCQMRVTNAISAVEGTVINSITPGMADITVQDDTQRQRVLSAIETAGYMASVANESTNHAGETFTFKTNINCASCVAQVAPVLDSAEGMCHWDVDTSGKDKILSVHSDGISREEIMDTVRKAGYKIEPVNT
ncbi:MAG TPA: heavy-metal-associated domain-containing protein [Saprospiraceae bacterium]|nr:heavy-metal-associated domain-containing protein [Saprospiraceae bacterium]